MKHGLFTRAVISRLRLGNNIVSLANLLWHVIQGVQPVMIFSVNIEILGPGQVSEGRDLDLSTYRLRNRWILSFSCSFPLEIKCWINNNQWWKFCVNLQNSLTCQKLNSKSLKVWLDMLQIEFVGSIRRVDSVNWSQFCNLVHCPLSLLINTPLRRVLDWVSNNRLEQVKAPTRMKCAARRVVFISSYLSLPTIISLAIHHTAGCVYIL